MNNHKIPATLTLKNKTEIHYVGQAPNKFFCSWPFEDDKGQKYIVQDCTIDDYKAMNKLSGQVLQIDYDSHNFDFHLYALKVKDFLPDVKKMHNIE